MCHMMQIIGTALLLSLILAASEAHRQKRSTCDAKYFNATPTHTMCLTDNADAVAVTLTQEVKDEIVELHNEIRSNVTDAANMMKMKWDDRLAAVAEKWAMQCILSHDNNNNRVEPDLPGFAGQNMAFSTGNMSFATAVLHWASEKQYYEYNVWNTTTGHYIQEIFAQARLVGCGEARCDAAGYYYKDYLVCNYYRGTVRSPHYVKGSSCDNCTLSCEDGLCDCTEGPDACFNGGTLNINSCQCQCTTLWTGATCTTKNCPAADYSYCPNWPDSYCDVYSNVPQLCPFKCNICP